MCGKIWGCAETTVNQLEMIVIEVNLRISGFGFGLIDDGGFLSIK